MLTKKQRKEISDNFIRQVFIQCGIDLGVASAAILFESPVNNHCILLSYHYNLNYKAVG